MKRQRLPENFALIGAIAFILTFPNSAQATDLTEREVTPFEDMDQNHDGLIDFEEFSTSADIQNNILIERSAQFHFLAGDDIYITAEEYSDGITLSQTMDKTEMTRHSGQNPLTENTNPDPIYGRILDVTPNEEVAGELIRTFEDERFEDDVI